MRPTSGRNAGDTGQDSPFHVESMDGGAWAWALWGGLGVWRMDRVVCNLDLL